MKKKQAIAFLLSTAMTTGTVLPVFGASNDISGHWAEATITKWQNDGKIGGYEDGTFKPDKTITRAEFVRLLNTATTTAFTSSANISFSDVNQSDWFFADVAKAVGSGVTSGFEDGTFRPSETVTRAQAAVFICKAKGIALDETRANLFADAAEIPAWAKGAVGGAVNAGYLSGYPDGTFGANKGMTRAEAVSTLDRLSGATNQPADPNQGVSTPSEKENQKQEQTTANAGDMVWTSGGSGGGRKSSSSSGGGSSSSSSNTISKAVTIRSQSDANDYKGKTLTGKATIYAKDGLELEDIRFKGDVDIIADSSAVAAAYTDGDVAVAANYLADIKIYFEGRTNISGTITVIKEGVPVGTQVIITTRTPRAISAIVKALIPTKIVGFEVPKVEASAPVEVAPNAKVGTITADDGASIVAEGEVNKVDVVGKVDNIALSGTGSTDVTVNDGAKVEKIDVNGSVSADVTVKGNAEVKNVAVSDKASADVAVNDTATVGNVAVSDNAEAKVDVKDSATVEKVELSDSAVAKVDVAPEAKVDTVTSTSTAAGSEVTGSGEVGEIKAPAGTLTTGSEVTTPVEDVTTDDNNSSGTTTPETVAVTGVSLNKATLSLEEGTSETLTATVTPENATNKKVTWKSDDETKVTVDANGKVTAVAETGTTAVTITATTEDGGKTATCAVTVTAKEEEQPVTPTEPTTEIIKLVKSATDGKYVLTASGTAKYEYAFAADENAPAADDAAWKPVTNAGTEITATDGMTYVHIRGVGGTSTAPTYSNTTLPIELTKITDIETAVESISIDETLALKVGGTDAEKTGKLTVTFNPAGATNQAVTWESSDDKVATVKDGVVTAVGAGTATITVTSAANPQATATCTVTVTAATQTGDTIPDTVISEEGTADGSSKITGLTAEKTYEYILTENNTAPTTWTAAAGMKSFTATTTNTTIELSKDDIGTNKYIHIRVAAAASADANPSKAIELVVKEETPVDNTAKPDTSKATAERDATTNTTVKVSGLSVADGKTVQYYAAATAVTDWAKVEDNAWKNTTATSGTYTITEVGADNTVIYFRYAAGTDATTEPASKPSEAVPITTAAPKLTATVSAAAEGIDLDNADDKVTVTVSDSSSLTTAGATAKLVFSTGEGEDATSFTIALTSDAVTVDSSNKTTKITFKPPKRAPQTSVGFEAGKTYTLVSGSVSGSGSIKLFDIVPDNNKTFITKPETDDDQAKKEAANTEAKKITAFTATSGSGENYKLTATGGSSLDSATITLVSVKQGTADASNPDGNTGTDITEHGATMDKNGDLTIPVATLVDATKVPDNASLYVTFKATKASVESDPVTVEIVAAQTIAQADIAALRTDVAAISAATLSATITEAAKATDVTSSPDNLSCTMSNAAEATPTSEDALDKANISKLALSIASNKLQITATLKESASLTSATETNISFTDVTLKSGEYTYKMTVPVAVKVTVTPA